MTSSSSIVINFSNLSSFGADSIDKVYEVTHGAVRLDRMAEVTVQVQDVAVAPSVALFLYHAPMFQILDNHLDGPFGDPHCLRHLAQSYGGVFCEAHEHVAMVGKKRPSGRVG